MGLDVGFTFVFWYAFLVTTLTPYLDSPFPGSHGLHASEYDV